MSITLNRLSREGKAKPVGGYYSTPTDDRGVPVRQRIIEQSKPKESTEEKFSRMAREVQKELDSSLE